MIIKKYIGESANEAISKVKQELGKDAVIISQRKIKKKGIKGLFSKKLIEVTAAIESSSESSAPKTYSVAKQKLVEDETNIEQNLIEALLKNSESNKEPIRKQDNISRETNLMSSNKNQDLLFNEVKEMKNMINNLVNSTNAEVNKVEEFLEEQDICKEIRNELLEKTKDINDEKERLEEIKELITKKIKIEPIEMNENIVFVGPTGVGKTTTIAKLAGRLALIEKKKVGLITIDTYRIGAVEQLKTYAEIMNIPFKVVFNLKDMEIAINSMDDCDVVLIDTTGRSSKNTMQISELRAYVEKANSKNINLVLSSTIKDKDVKIINEAYKVLNFNKVIITKLDETSTYGSIVNILKEVEVPISFITTGQNVPEDIECPKKDNLVNLIMGESSVC
ncbi:flagellar biosynthesis protein FlhF [Clostridium ihumii]|uniref:flagellar biosynthesis protein FlhF n=1 Tax=Clostridium ihumii TaxID=1470356 RepID=UPI00058B3E50|nr:flagellar biosynthesis protein FlhF [Clostridium ihumii]